MDGKDVTKALRTYMNELKTQNISNLKISDFEAHIDLAEKYACQCYDRHKMEHESKLEMFKSVISSGANAIKAAMLINGGGAVALLAFAGKVSENKNNYVDINFLSTALFFFCLGVLMSAVASGTTYFAQKLYTAYGNTKPGHVVTSITVILILASYYSFFTAIHKASLALGLNPVSLFTLISQ